jgi:hypothetical protein
LSRMKLAAMVNTPTTLAMMSHSCYQPFTQLLIVWFQSQAHQFATDGKEIFKMQKHTE